MTITVEAYHQRWQKAMEPDASLKDWPWFEQEITPTVCIFFEGAVHSALGGGEGYNILPDFGDGICWYRYFRYRDEFEGEGQPLSPEEMARKEMAQRNLDALLERYVHEGYQHDMGYALKATVKRSFREWELLLVYNLPEDLPRLLEDCGNPHVPEDEEAAAGQAPVFDFDNPDHRRALKISLEV